MSSEHFNVVTLLEALRNSLDGDDVLLDGYCKSFQELAKYSDTILFNIRLLQDQSYFYLIDYSLYLVVCLCS